MSLPPVPESSVRGCAPFTVLLKLIGAFRVLTVIGPSCQAHRPFEVDLPGGRSARAADRAIGGDSAGRREAHRAIHGQSAAGKAECLRRDGEAGQIRGGADLIQADHGFRGTVAAEEAFECQVVRAGNRAAETEQAAIALITADRPSCQRQTAVEGNAIEPTHIACRCRRRSRDP